MADFTGPPPPGHPGWLRLLEEVGTPHTEHPVDGGVLGEYATVLASRGEAEADRLFPQVAEHLSSGCPACAADLKELVQFASELQAPSDAMVDVGRSTVGEKMGDTLHHLADMVIGPRLGALIGVRGPGDEGLRVYVAGSISITLTDAETSGIDPPGILLSGIVTWEERESAELAGVNVRLLRADVLAASTTLDTLAGFHFDGLSPGTYALEVDFPDRVVRLDEVALP